MAFTKIPPHTPCALLMDFAPAFDMPANPAYIMVVNIRLMRLKICCPGSWRRGGKKEFFRGTLLFSIPTAMKLTLMCAFIWVYRAGSAVSASRTGAAAAWHPGFSDRIPGFRAGRHQVYRRGFLFTAFAFCAAGPRWTLRKSGGAGRAGRRLHSLAGRSGSHKYMLVGRPERWRVPLNAPAARSWCLLGVGAPRPSPT